MNGSYDELIKYLNGTDYPQSLWTFLSLSEVKSYTGFSCVSKKDPTKQRKVLMQCAANFAFSPGKGRADHGLHGGSAISRAHSPSNHIAAAAMDENNAFTRVITPRWWWAWACIPPVLARDV